ncbi:TPA: hypothetical protein ACH3X2_007479 [Trebouxia sp. C0005]
MNGWRRWKSTKSFCSRTSRQQLRWLLLQNWRAKAKSQYNSCTTDAVFYADKLHALEQPAVPTHKGRSEQLSAEVQNNGAAALSIACKEFKAE